MEIREDIYIGLMILFVALICLAFFFMYQYNEDRKEVVADLESKGYVCTKDPIGFYKSCTRPDDLQKLGIDIDFNSCEG